MSTTQSTQAQLVLNNLRRMKEEIAIVKELFTDLFPEFDIDDRQCRVWLNRYDLVPVCESLERTSDWYNECLCAIQEWRSKNSKPIGKQPADKEKLDILKYASGVMKHKTKEAAKEK